MAAQSNALDPIVTAHEDEQPRSHVKKEADHVYKAAILRPEIFADSPGDDTQKDQEDDEEDAQKLRAPSPSAVRW